MPSSAPPNASFTNRPKIAFASIAPCPPWPVELPNAIVEGLKK